MDKFLDRPWFLRLTALFLAVILFFTVKGEEQASRNTAGDIFALIQDVPVEVYYDTENLVVTGVPDMVNMTIEGPPNIVQTTKLLKDFSLKLDLQDLTLGEHTVRIQAENLSDKLDVRLEPATVHVNIEEKVTQSFRVDPEMNTRLLAEGYEMSKIEVQPSTISVTGAKSIVEAISFVKVSVTGDANIDKSFEQQARVRILDRDLNKLSVSVEPEEVTVKVDIQQYSQSKPVKIVQKGKLPEGLTLDSLAPEDKTVKIYGPKNTVDAVKEIPVEVDVSKLKKSGKVEVEIRKPEGIAKVSPAKLKVQAVVSGTTAESEEASEPEEQTEQDTAAAAEPEVIEQAAVTQQFADLPVTVRNLDPAYTATFKQPSSGKVTLQVTGKQQDVEGLKPTELVVYADAATVGNEGDVTVPLLVEAPAGITWKLAMRNAILFVQPAEKQT